MPIFQNYACTVPLNTPPFIPAKGVHDNINCCRRYTLRSSSASTLSDSPDFQVAIQRKYEPTPGTVGPVVGPTGGEREPAERSGTEEGMQYAASARSDHLSCCAKIKIAETVIGGDAHFGPRKERKPHQAPTHP